MNQTTVGALADRVPGRQPGLYLLGVGEHYLYVGKSKRCAWRRMVEHLGLWSGDQVQELVRDHTPDSDAWTVAVLPHENEATLSRAEEHLIRALRPLLNVTHGNGDPWPEWLHYDRFGRRQAREEALAKRAQAREWAL